MKAEKLTARSTKNNMAYLLKVKDGEQCVDGSYNTLQCIQEAFEKLAQYEEKEAELEHQARLGRAVQKAFSICDELGVQQIRKIPTIEKLIEWAEQEGMK